MLTILTVGLSDDLVDCIRQDLPTGSAVAAIKPSAFRYRNCAVQVYNYVVFYISRQVDVKHSIRTYDYLRKKNPRILIVTHSKESELLEYLAAYTCLGVWHPSNIKQVVQVLKT
jgi:hypothetical protein